ncbi:hypothetical protein [Streptococcus thoraltensis]|uniref:hypothetical protein n=1 Tax=Streptococcus thoraltensis TaxID=55085 RepID=UPI0003641789|nr:hypothetical protein [Streptococcus thoraltensis]
MVTSDFKGASSIPTIKGRSLPWVKTINASVAKFSDDGEEAAKKVNLEFSTKHPQFLENYDKWESELDIPRKKID